jgi:hypothetical protein
MPRRPLRAPFVLFYHGTHPGPSPDRPTRFQKVARPMTMNRSALALCRIVAEAGAYDAHEPVCPRILLWLVPFSRFGCSAGPLNVLQ